MSDTDQEQIIEAQKIIEASKAKGLEIYLVFIHNTTNPKRGAWNDFSGGTNKFFIASSHARHIFQTVPTVTIAQVVNRFSGKVELELTR